VRWGVLAPDEIAGNFPATVHVNTDQRIIAVASRSVDRAIRFASTHGIERAMGSYEQLLSDPDIDVVYIAAPQSEHHALSLLAISAGKPVLIEKPIAMSAAQAGEIAQASRSAGVFAAEAMWTRYLPQFDVLQQVLERGDLGMIKLATADVGWRVERDTAPARFFDPAQGGGVSLDMGVYGYWFAQFAIGAPRLIRTLCTSTGGVEDQAVVIIAGPGDRQAAVSTSMAVTTSGLAAIYGTRGNARFLEPFVFPASFVISVGDSVHEWHDTSGLRMRAGLAWQATAVASFIAAGLLDSPLHSLDDAISIMRTIDTVRAPTEH
jgi:predicted dehydrogenase